jgi:DNA-binding transcriptional LysR family regulator
MRFRSFDNLRLFDVVARHLSFTAAAGELNLTKGAVSYQITRLESALGFKLFTRRSRGILLTDKGKRLWHASQAAFNDLEREIALLREEDTTRITIGMATYFASRWLSPRLMSFMAAQPRIGLRLQPLVDLIDLERAHIDMAIRWGSGAWSDLVIEPLLPCPAFPTAGAVIARTVAEMGLEAALSQVTLLHDREGSTAWIDWHEVAGMAMRATWDGLVIPDPNVRVQAVIDGQGVALYDALAAPELGDARLHRISEVELSDYGYFLAYPKGALANPSLKLFRDWIVSEAG